MLFRASLAAVVAGLLLAVPGTARGNMIAHELVAYGEGATTCTITMQKRRALFSQAIWDFYGQTDCSVAVEQTGHAVLETQWERADGGLCSGVRKTCWSGQPFADCCGTLSPPMEYRVTLRAPSGQGWVASPDACSGAGTDNLVCTFLLDDLTVFWQ